MLPPEAMMIPLLPVHANGKLIFGLCSTCIEEERPGLCTHSKEQRTMTSTWTSIEVEAALKYGYELVQMHECIMYRESLPVFREFFLKLAKIKIGAEGFDRDDLTEEEKQAYVDKLNLEMPGLELGVDEVRRNWPRRQCAKEVSNAGLGKLGQSDIKKNVQYVNSWRDISEIKYSADRELLTTTPLTDNLAEVVFTTKENRTGFQKNTNVTLYSFITARSRLCMFEDMQIILKSGGVSSTEIQTAL